MFLYVGSIFLNIKPYLFIYTLEIPGRLLIGLSPTLIVILIFFKSADFSREPEPEVSLSGVVDKAHLRTEERGVREEGLFLG